MTNEKDKVPERLWYAKTKWGMIPLTNGPSAKHDNVEYVRLDRKYFCSCGAALTAEEYITHYFELGHDHGINVKTPASAAPVVDKGSCIKCGHFSTIDIHDEGPCQVRGQSGFICGCKCEFTAACAKCGHSAGVERTLKRCKARIDGGEALCQCHCVFPAAATAAPVEHAATKTAEQIVGTVFDNTGASYETLKRTMIERITQYLEGAR